MKRIGLVLCVALSLMLAIPASAFAQPAAGNQLFSGQAHQVGQVNVANLPPAQDDLQGPARTLALRALPTQTGQALVAQGTSFVSSLSSSVTANLVLNGVFGGAPNPCGCTPPDPNSGVSQRFVFEMVNIAGIIYLKNGAVAKSTFSLADFFGVPLSSEIGDPEVMFDAASNTWFASSIVAPNDVRFAVSTSPDPTGTFILYQVSGGAFFPDQPFIGTSDDKFVISVNAFTAHAFAGALFWVFNKAELLSGAATIDFVVHGPDSTMVSVHPARHLTSTSVFYLVAVVFGTSSTAMLVTVTGVPPGTVAVTVNNFAINPIAIPPSAIQEGTGIKLTTNDDRVLSAVWESNVLWFSLNDACQPSGDVRTRSCARLIELTTSGTASPTKLQDFDFGVRNSYVFYPAISVSNGKLVVVYGESSSTMFPSLLVTGRLPTDPVNSLDTSVILRSGTAPDTSTRYGDYFGAATDPSGGSFWVTGEYRVDDTFQNWSTAIAQVTVA